MYNCQNLWTCNCREEKKAGKAELHHAVLKQEQVFWGTFDSRRRLRATDNFGLSPPGPCLLLLLCYLCPTLIGFPHHFYHRQHVPRYQFYWEFDPKTSPTQLQSFDVQQCDRTPATETFWFKEICILMLFKITRVQAENALPILRTSHICPRTRRSCSSTLN